MSKITSSTSPLSVAVCRPAIQGKQLTEALEKAGFKAFAQPFFSTEPALNTAQITAELEAQQPEIIIFVSSTAVDYAQQALAITKWRALIQQSTTFIAVGQTTAKALHAYNINAVIVPEQENSEGLLALNILQHVTNKNIMIVRGDHGRELLADTLKARLANVRYLASYKKVWRQYNANILAKQWQKYQINCIVITSVALLDTLVNLLAASSSKTYWLKHCYWVVASPRIAKQAKMHNINKVITANGASDQAIINKILTMDLHND
jgi:uroporphyrinogen-III synthase